MSESVQNMNSLPVPVSGSLMKKNNATYSKLALKKSMEAEELRKQLNTAKVDKQTYQLIAAGLFVILMSILIMAKF